MCSLRRCAEAFRCERMREHGSSSGAVDRSHHSPGSILARLWETLCACMLLLRPGRVSVARESLVWGLPADRPEPVLRCGRSVRAVPDGTPYGRIRLLLNQAGAQNQSARIWCKAWPSRAPTPPPPPGDTALSIPTPL